MASTPPGFYLMKFDRDTWIVKKKYQNLKPIATTRNNLICSATDVESGKQVAIKKYYSIHYQGNAEHVYRDIKISKLLSLYNTNVIELLDLYIPSSIIINGDSPLDHIYLVTALMEADLGHVLRCQRLSNKQVQFLAYQIFRGLKYIHSAGVVHRNLKPSDIGVDTDVYVKILNFGFDRRNCYGDERVNSIRFTLAPEVIINVSKYGQKADVWCVGCILAEMLTGNRLFIDTSTYATHLKAILEFCGFPDEEMISKMTSNGQMYLKSFPKFERKDFSQYFVNADPVAIDLVDKLLQFNPDKRLSAAEALEHPYFIGLHEKDDEPVCGEQYVPISDELSLKEWLKLIYEEVNKPYTPPSPPVDDEKDTLDRENRYTAQLAHALKEGSIPLSIIKCVFQGPPRVGKTHVKCLLLKQKMEKHGSDPTLSTPCAEHPQRVIRKVTSTAYAGRKGDEQWILMDDELMETMISKMAGELNIPTLTEKFQFNFKVKAAAGVMKSLREKINLTAKLESTMKDSSNTAEINAEVKATSSENIMESGHESMKTKEEGARVQLERPMSQPTIHHQDLLYFIDSGGQPQFQEVLQSFIPSTNVLLLAFNLTQRLSDSPLIQYQTDQGTHTLGRYAISNEEIISRFARMVYSSNSKVHVGLIGTHYDQYSPDEHETIEEKNTRLLQIFSFCKDRLLYSDIFTESLLFPVNALQAEDGVFDNPVVCQLRKAIDFVLDNIKEVEVPLRWYAFELAMQQYAETESIQVLSMEICIGMAKDLQFPEEDVPAALDFLAKYNLILYYPSILPNVVFTSPQVLLDKVTELTECVYILDAGRSIACSRSFQQPPPSGEYLIMKDEGVITDQILRGFPKYYKSGLFTFENLIEIFQHLYIINRRDDGRYFMPALLPLFTPSELTHLYDPSKPPLLFNFIEGCAPTGLFCALLVCLTSPSREWKVGHQLESSPLKGIRSNAACLIDPKFRILVVLVDSFCQFEVHYRCHAKEEKFLPHIRSTVASALEEVIRNRKFNISFPEIGFWCEAVHPSKPHRHVCTLVNKQLKCSIDPMADCKTIPSIIQWMASLPSDRVGVASLDLTQNTPTLPKLLRVGKEVAHKWFEMGMELEVPYAKLESIQNEKNNDIARLVEVFACWQKSPSSDRPFTWETMEDVLRDMKDNTLANKVKEKYNAS